MEKIRNTAKILITLAMIATLGMAVEPIPANKEPWLKVKRRA